MASSCCIMVQSAHWASLVDSVAETRLCKAKWTKPSSKHRVTLRRRAAQSSRQLPLVPSDRPRTQDFDNTYLKCVFCSISSNMLKSWQNLMPLQADNYKLLAKQLVMEANVDFCYLSLEKNICTMFTSSNCLLNVRFNAVVLIQTLSSSVF